MLLVNSILRFLKHALLPSLCYLFSKFMIYVPKMPRWVEPMPSLICVNSKVMRIIPYWLSSDKISILQLHQEQEIQWKVMHCRSGSRPWTLCSCPRTRCGTYHESFLQGYLIIWIILPVSKLDPLQLWSRPYFLLDPIYWVSYNYLSSANHSPVQPLLRFTFWHYT